MWLIFRRLYSRKEERELKAQKIKEIKLLPNLNSNFSLEKIIFKN